MSGRMIDPFDTVRANAQRRAGVPDPRDLRLEQTRAQRYDDVTPLEAKVVGWETPNQGADQTITATTFTQIDGTLFELSFEGADEATWAGMLTYRIVIASTGAIDTDVYARILVDWGDGTFRDTDIDLTTSHGAVTAFGIIDYAESSATGVAFSLKPTAALKVRGGSTIRVVAAAHIGTAGQSAVVQLTNVTLNPHCVGFMIPYRRVR